MIVENNNNNENTSTNNITPPGEFRPWGMEKKQFLMLMHLSQFAGYIAVGLGFAAPIVMWLMFRDEDADIDRHGKEIVNFTISFFIYLVISGILVFFLVGFVLLLGLALANLIFVIMGALKAQEGGFYKYPLTIEFFK